MAKYPKMRRVHNQKVNTPYTKFNTMLKIKDLRSSIFNMKTLDAKLTCMAMIHSLGPEYSNFMSSLALLTDLDKVKVKAAFPTEEINHHPCLDTLPIPATDSALSTSLSGCNCPKNAPCKFCEKPPEGTASASAIHSREPRSTTSQTRARRRRARKHRQLLPLPQALRMSLSALAMQVFVLPPLIPSCHSCSMLTMIGMQTRGPLLI